MRRVWYNPKCKDKERRNIMQLFSRYRYINSKNNSVVIEVQIYPLTEDKKYIVRVYNGSMSLCLASWPSTEEELREHFKKVGCKYE